MTDDMMSEERFTTKGIIISHYGVWDTDDKPYANDDVVDLLNSLAEENEQLRHEIEIEKKWQLAQDRYYVKIKEENEQLRKELDNFKPIIFKNMQKGTIILYSKGDNDE